MKRQFIRFGPWVLMMAIGTVAVPRYAETAPAPAPPQEFPHIRASVDALQAAREELRTAAHDFCGHRADALRDTDAALKQLRAAIACRK